MATEVTIVTEKGKKYLVTKTELPADDATLELSSSMKNRNLASTGGFMPTPCTWQGKLVKVNLNAIVKA